MAYPQFGVTRYKDRTPQERARMFRAAQLQAVREAKAYDVGADGGLGLSWNIGRTINKLISNVNVIASKAQSISDRAQAAAQQVQVGAGAVKGALTGAQTGAQAGGGGVMLQQQVGDVVKKNPTAVLVGGGLLALLVIRSLGRR